MPKVTTPKKRGRPAIGLGTTIGMRLRPDELEALDRCLAEQDDRRATRAGLCAWIVAEALTKDGYLKDEEATA